ncbi:MAG: Uncharacterised protein [Porticoccaceae bacterium UBA1117]|nr:MAG: Uncharacterised protein [Porticoccaceae bacterium UBA1117]
MLTIPAIISALMANCLAFSLSCAPSDLETSAPAAIDVPMEIEVAKKVNVLAKPIAATRSGSPKRLINHISSRSTMNIDMSPNALVLAITIM